MGYPGKNKKTFDKPSHPWQGTRISAEAELVKSYGLKNKREIWKAATTLRKYRRESRKLLFETQELGERGEHAKIEREKFLSKLRKIGLIQSDSTLDDVLTLKVEDVLERRLQTRVHKKGLANSTKQSRQLIVHGHVAIGGRRVTVPSYAVPMGEEEIIEFYKRSPMYNNVPVESSKADKE
ncbi:MAG TPA: 30S ribosomal protein S4 [Candidatus Acidoferrales bacterium]|jgi:small subunit ribosomal protein S4|nr:30S ribosomal protein S4 [Candidatus Acidoferrales bacterium]